MFNFPAGLSDPLDEIFDIQRSLRFRSSASANLTRTPASAGNRQKWTWSGWVKRGAMGVTSPFFAYSTTGIFDSFGFSATDQFYYASVDTSGTVTRANYASPALFRDTAAWYHFVIAVDTTQAVAADRLKAYVNGVALSLTVNSAFAQNWNTYINAALAHNVAFHYDGGNRYFDGYMGAVCFVDGQALDPSYFGKFHPKTGQWRPKRYSGSYGTNGFYLPFSDGSSVAALGLDKSGNGNNWTPTNISLATSPVPTDYVVPTLYAHAGYIGTSGTLWMNIRSVGGVLQYQLFDNATWVNWTGAATALSTLVYATEWRNEGEGYRITGISQVGSTLTVTIDVWDQNIGWRWGGVTYQYQLTSPATTYDWMLDTPTDNYPVINSAFAANGFVAGTISEGGLKFASSTTYHLTPCTIPIPASGKHMAEFTVVDGAGFVGVADLSNGSGSSQNIGGGYAWYGTAIYTGNASAVISGLTAWAANDIIGVAVDMAALTAKWYRNGTLVATQALSSGKDYAFACGDYHSTVAATVYANFGQRAFAYPIAGYTPLSTKRLAFTKIANAKSHFDVVTYAGNGSSQSIASAAFKPDLAWLKSRSGAADHAIVDAVRGFSFNTYANATANGFGGIGWNGGGSYVATGGGTATTGGATGGNYSGQGGGGGGGASGGAGGAFNNNGATTGGSAYVKVYDGATLLTTISSNATYVVPAGKTSLTFEVRGGNGGISGYSVGGSVGVNQGWGAGGGGGGASIVARGTTVLAGANGGKGGNSSAGGPYPGTTGSVTSTTLAVTPGESLGIFVGGDGGGGGNGYYTSGGGGGYGGGGGGGMAGDWGASAQGGAGGVASYANTLASDTTAAETQEISCITGLIQNGFAVGSDARVNSSGGSYVGWLWKAGGAPVANNAGSIASQVSANTQAGFSIVTYTGTGANGTVGHGLGIAPKVVIVKTRTGITREWAIYHGAMPSVADFILLSNVAAKQADATVFNGAPTSTVFNVGTSPNTNGSTIQQVAYCFAEVPGFSKFGSYVGNGSADGPMVYCGFRPKFVMVKRVDSTSDWYISDGVRSPANVINAGLLANSTAIESGGYDNIDFLSNGFKQRDASAVVNGAGGTFIFMAFAEFPFRYANAR